MGLLAGLSSVAAPPRMRGMTNAEYNQAFFSGDPVPEPWLGMAGGLVSPDVALALTYVYSAVDIISSDFGTMTCQMFENQGEDQKRRVQYGDAGIGSLAYKLRWKPNSWQTAKAFWSTLAWQYQLRPAAYAEIIYRPGLNGFVDQIIPRHPDRVKQEVLPSGRLRFEIREPNGTARYVTQDEMLVVRNTSADGLNAISRIDYGAKAIATGLRLQDFTHNYFAKGASAALLATYKGTKEDPDEDALHKSITRFMSGAENAGGLMLVPEDIDVKALGVDPEKSELIGLKNISGRDVARLFKMPPSWLGIEGAQSYNSLIQDSQLYVIRVQMPLVVEFEQAIQRDLILAALKYYAKFNMDYLVRGDLKQRMEAYEIGIRSRVIRPSEARVREDLNPDPALDALSERDNQPGQAGSSRSSSATDTEARYDRAGLKGVLALHENAQRCLRRERAAVEKLAVKHANDVPAWKAALKTFYQDHASFVAQVMRVSGDVALAYAAEHGAAFEAKGIGLISGDAGEAWQQHEADELTLLALRDERVAA